MSQNFGEYVNQYLTTCADMTKAIMGKKRCKNNVAQNYRPPFWDGKKISQPPVSPCQLSLLQISVKLLAHLGSDDDARGRSTLGLVPQSTMREFYLQLPMFNVGKDSKSGCLGAEKNLTQMF